LIDDEVGGGGGGTGGTTSLGGSGGGRGSTSFGGTGGGGGSGAIGGSGGSVSSPSASEPYHFETNMLEGCTLGFVWSAADSRPCTFRFADRCYDDDDAVCACACPRNANSVCVLSGFLSDPDNPLMVTCTAKP